MPMPPPQTTTPFAILSRFLSSPSPSHPPLPELLRVHALAVTSGLSPRPDLAAKLVSAYSSAGRPGLAALAFSSSPCPDAFLWNSLIRAHHCASDFAAALVAHRRMLASGARPSRFTAPLAASASAELGALGVGASVHAYSVRLAGDGGTRPNSRTMESGLEACGMLGELNSGRCLHGYAVKVGVGDSPSVDSGLFSMYSKCQNTEDASVLFLELPEKDVVSWTSLIGTYCRRGLMTEAMELLQEMVESGLQPDEVLVSCLLAGLGNSGNVHGGKAFHTVITKRNYEGSVLTGNALISMYGKFELVDIACRVFRSLHQRNAESWNLMVVGYCKAGCDVKCLGLYREMQLRDKDEFLCDANSLVSAISSCSRLEELRLGRSAHCYSIKHLLDDNLSVANVLIGMYGRCGKFDHACKIFGLAKLKGDIVTWNALISSYAHLGHSNAAVSLYDQMLTEGLKPNSATLITVISACANLAALERGEQIHSYVKEIGWESDVSISTALIDMYAKCGQLGIARRIFDSMFERDVVAWNVMISGYGMHGKAKLALELFDDMERGSIKPNSVTFLAILSACCHSGFVEEGRELFTKMGKYSLEPNLKHYACMVDLLGKSGHLQEAEDMVLAMPVEPDGGVWGTLLSACKVHDNFEMGLRIAKKAFASDPENDGYYILTSNSYGSVKKWDEIEKLREMMKNHGVGKGVGWSAVDNCR
ncbi:hypothetical protein HU200_027536 [Digitaria exilis]|uniref:Pentatricopeptide repeat-containing protein n=1 Tax=Digitaria exilis TaxID=1010633 RepID=A0A835ETJ9_9POAL|nr:hypothetical protein HU200_027536 [Digitaria exilis]